MRSTAIIGLALALAGCGDDREPARQPQNPQPPRRVIEPPSGTVRLLPPYAISANDVGPYKVGMKLAALLDKLPSGPRIARLEIPGVVHTSLIRAEDGTVLIGSEPSAPVASSTTTFVAVIGPDVARADHGIHVGSKRAELDKLAPFVEDVDRARDPRLVVPIAMRNMRLVTERERVAAIVLGGVANPRTRTTEVVAPPCPRPHGHDEWFGACLTGAGELVEVADDWITVRSGESQKTISTIRVPNLVYAVPLRNVNDGRDELVALARTDEPQQRTWTVVVFRIEPKRHVVVVDPMPIYTLSSAQTRWIGADLRDIDLYLEFASQPDGIEVGGLLTTRAGDKLRDVVVISPVTISRHQPNRPATGEPADAGLPDGAESDKAPTSGADSAKL